MSNDSGAQGQSRPAQGGPLALLKAQEPALKRALPSFMRPDYFLRVALTYCQQDSKLCGPQTDGQSLLAAFMEGAQLGLPLDGILGHGHLVPFWDKKVGKYIITFIAGYHGLMNLAKRSGEIHHFECRVVWTGDQFDYSYGDNPFLTHKPCDVQDREPDQRLGWTYSHTYAIAFYKEGPSQFEVMAYDDIMRIKAGAKAESARAPWNAHEVPQAKKTSMRQLCKWLDVSTELTRQVGKDEAWEQARWAEFQMRDESGKGASLDSLVSKKKNGEEEPPEPEPPAKTPDESDSPSDGPPAEAATEQVEKQIRAVRKIVTTSERWNAAKFVQLCTNLGMMLDQHGKTMTAALERLREAPAGFLEKLIETLQRDPAADEQAQGQVDEISSITTDTKLSILQKVDQDDLSRGDLDRICLQVHGCQNVTDLTEAQGLHIIAGLEDGTIWDQVTT